MERLIIRMFIISVLVFLGVALIETVNASGINCDKHPIYCQIKNNRRKINKKYAMKLSNIIYKVSIKHKIPSKIFTAILMQESLYKLEVSGCHKGLIVVETDKGVEYREQRICSDFGISQIYYRTARGFGLDIDRLTSDLAYSVEAGAIVLADFKRRYGKREKTWWTRYNARSKDKRRVYRVLVERFL